MVQVANNVRYTKPSLAPQMKLESPDLAYDPQVPNRAKPGVHRPRGLRTLQYIRGFTVIVGRTCMIACLSELQAVTWRMLRFVADVERETLIGGEKKECCKGIDGWA